MGVPVPVLPPLPGCRTSVALGGRWPARLVLFAAALVRLPHSRSEFLPARDPAAIHGGYAFCRPAPISANPEAYAGAVERFMRAQPGVTHISSFIGGGALRFLLVYTPERQNPAFVQFLVEVDDDKKIDGLIAEIQKYLDNNYPERQRCRQEVSPGPGQRRTHSAAVPRSRPCEHCAHWPQQAERIIEDDGGAIGVRSDWREREKVIRPELLELQARRNGITRVNVAEALETGFEGRVRRLLPRAGQRRARESSHRRQGCCRSSLVPPRRSEAMSRMIQSMQIWSPAAKKMIPMSQVVSGVEVDWEDPVVMRRNRNPTITVHADPRSGLPAAICSTGCGRDSQQIKLPPGYSLEWGGEYEDSQEARAALAKPLPGALMLMVFIVVCLFNSIRSTLVICLAVPLAIIGVTAGLLITNQPFGFMALLGVIALWRASRSRTRSS